MVVSRLSKDHETDRTRVLLLKLGQDILLNPYKCTLSWSKDTNCLSWSKHTHCLSCSKGTYFLSCPKDTCCLSRFKDTYCLSWCVHWSRPSAGESPAVSAAPLWPDVTGSGGSSVTLHNGSCCKQTFSQHMHDACNGGKQRMQLLRLLLCAVWGAIQFRPPLPAPVLQAQAKFILALLVFHPVPFLWPWEVAVTTDLWKRTCAVFGQAWYEVWCLEDQALAQADKSALGLVQQCKVCMLQQGERRPQHKWSWQSVFNACDFFKRTTATLWNVGLHPCWVQCVLRRPTARNINLWHACQEIDSGNQTKQCVFAIWLVCC